MFSLIIETWNNVKKLKRQVKKLKILTTLNLHVSLRNDLYLMEKQVIVINVKGSGCWTQPVEIKKYLETP